MSDSAQLDVEATIKSFPCYAGSPSPDHVIDYLGTRTRAAYVRGLKGGTIEGFPLPMNFHATALEWAGALAAVTDAADELIAVELGAGWAPWLVSVNRAARLRGIAKLRLMGVEGSRKHCEYMRTHFADNGLDPDEHALLHGVVAPSDGMAEFPVLEDPAVDWGTSALLPVHRAKGKRASHLRGLGRRLANAVLKPFHPDEGLPARTERLRCYSIGTLLRPFEFVDLVHIDIQGHEYVVLAAARDVLKKKVKRIVVGTHGREIEERLFEEMSTAGWLLEAEESCLYRQLSGRMSLWRDGCQVWRNPDLARSCGSAHAAA